MYYLLSFIEFLATSALFFYVLPNVIYPLFYTVPMTVYYVCSDQIEVKAFFVCGLRLALWAAITFAIRYLLYVLASVHVPLDHVIASNQVFNTAFYLPFLITLCKLIIPKRRKEIRDEYYIKVISNNLTASASSKVKSMTKAFEKMSNEAFLNFRKSRINSRNKTGFEGFLIENEYNRRSF